MSSGWEFDIDDYLYEGKSEYLALFDASYCHMGTEKDCESVGKKMKARIQNR